VPVPFFLDRCNRRLRGRSIPSKFHYEFARELCDRGQLAILALPVPLRHPVEELDLLDASSHKGKHPHASGRWPKPAALRMRRRTRHL
jgi:hypothetical protein